MRDYKEKKMFNGLLTAYTNHVNVLKLHTVRRITILSCSGLRRRRPGKEEEVPRKWQQVLDYSWP